jgi:hypothetical protein
LKPSMRHRKTAFAGAAIAACLTLGLSGTLPAFAASDPALDATDASVSAVEAHQSVFSEAFLWQTLQSSAQSAASAGLFTNEHVEFVGGLPTELTPVVDYTSSAAGEPAWAYTPASATALRFQVKLAATRISDGAQVESPIHQLGIAEQEWHPSAGQLPTGTAADWAWSAPISTMSNKFMWGDQSLSGSDQQWVSNIQCLAVPLSSFEAPAGGGWSIGVGTDFTPTPTSMGAMANGAESTGDGYLNGLDHIPYVGRVSTFQPYFTPTISVDVKSACPGLRLTGDLYISGADVKTGGYQFDDTRGNGNHVGWASDGSPGGVLTSADVSALPDNSGHVTFRFAKTPAPGEAGTGATDVWALTAAGTKVRLTVGYWFTNYGGAPIVSDLNVDVPLGQTTTVTESDLRAKARFFSNQSPTIDVSALPAGVTETSTDSGERAFSYTALTAGDTRQFTFRAAETQTPAGMVQSGPATVTFTAIGGGGAVAAPAVPAPEPVPIVSG